MILDGVSTKTSDWRCADVANTDIKGFEKAGFDDSKWAAPGVSFILSILNLLNQLSMNI